MYWQVLVRGATSYLPFSSDIHVTPILAMAYAAALRSAHLAGRLSPAALTTLRGG